MASLPYLTSPGNVEKAFTGIKSAATPDNVNLDFVKTILKIPGGSGNEMTSFLKKIGFARSDGTPTDIYAKFRNDRTSKAAMGEAMKFGYAELKTRNEYWFALPDADLRGVIIEVTGSGSEDRVVSLIMSTIKGLKKFATFDKQADVVEPMRNEPERGQPPMLPPPAAAAASIGLNLGYTINLNLPATTDIAVFNAIFKSLKEHLLEAPREG